MSGTSGVIVAEISRNWDRSKPRGNEPILAEKFEMVIDVNAQRGYRLQSWTLSRVQNNEWISETIIAVFQEVEQ